MSKETNNPLIDYQVDHLFTLVGENPLPAYIAAKTLLKDHGTVYLVYTARTKKMAEAITEKLRPQDITVDTVPLEGYASAAFKIRERVGNKANKIATDHPDARIGLNYTGGTGPMGVHSYQAILDVSPDAVFSYLDPRQLKMCIDKPSSEPIRRDVPFTMMLEDMIKLHSLRLKEPLKTEPVMLEAANEFAILHASAKNKAEQWRKWCNMILKKHTRSESKWKPSAELAQLPPLPLSVAASVCEKALAVPDGFRKGLATYLGATEDEISLHDAVANSTFADEQEVCAWLDGTWLESYVLDQVQSLDGIDESARSIRIQHHTHADKEQFEFDVAFVKGYQLFAISCTTATSRDTSKLKLLEASIRARQLGGDEARVALVCLSNKDDRDGLRKELALVLSNRKIAVFGREDLPDLWHKLKQWVDDNSRGEAEA